MRDGDGATGQRMSLADIERLQEYLRANGKRRASDEKAVSGIGCYGERFSNRRDSAWILTGKRYGSRNNESFEPQTGGKLPLVARRLIEENRQRRINGGKRAAISAGDWTRL
jgi:hypothetical protein